MATDSRSMEVTPSQQSYAGAVTSRVSGWVLWIFFVENYTVFPVIVLESSRSFLSAGTPQKEGIVEKLERILPRLQIFTPIVTSQRALELVS